MRSGTLSLPIFRSLGLAASLAAFACDGCGAASHAGAAPTGTAAAPDVAAWILPYADSLASLERNAAWLTIASPTYFRLAVSGKSAILEDWDPAVPFPRARLDAVRARMPSLEVLPLVGCIGPCGPQISRVLDDPPARSAHVADLLRVAREQNLAGLFIDYEDVDATEPSVSAFVDELATGLHGAGKKLALVVQEPCGVDPACKRMPYPFDLRTLVDKVDHLAIMEYDFAVDGSAAPAPRAWVSRGLAKVVSEVGPGPRVGKIMCAVPLYGRVTTGIADDTAVLFSDVQPGRVRNAHATVGALTLDPAALSKVATVSSGTKTGTLYLEDHETLAARLELASGFGLGGVALWRLGGEDPCAGAALARYRKIVPPACE
jgi:hypothetical protein